MEDVFLEQIPETELAADLSETATKLRFPLRDAQYAVATAAIGCGALEFRWNNPDINPRLYPRSLPRFSFQIKGKFYFGYRLSELRQKQNREVELGSELDPLLVNGSRRH